MFAILVPASLSPLIITLFWAERKAKKLQLVEAPVSTLEAPVRVPILRRIWLYAEQLDIVGLAILGTAVALILLPLTLAQGAKGQWHNRECTPRPCRAVARFDDVCSVDDCYDRRWMCPSPRLCDLGRLFREAPRHCAPLPYEPVDRLCVVDWILRLCKSAYHCVTGATLTAAAVLFLPLVYLLVLVRAGDEVMVCSPRYLGLIRR